MLYEVWVQKTTGGRIRVEADSPDEAFDIAESTDEDDWDVEWGSCGDEVEVFNDVQEAYVPPEVQADPEWTQYLKLRKKFGQG